MATSSTVAVGSSRSWSTYVAVALSIVAYFGARGVLEMDTLAAPWRVAAAIVPIPLFGWVLFRLVQGSRELDEMQRRMQLEALAIAYPLTS